MMPSNLNESGSTGQKIDHASGHQELNGNIAALRSTWGPNSIESPRAHELSLASIRLLSLLLITQVRARWWVGLLAAAIVGGGLSWPFLRGPGEAIAATTLLAQGPLDKILNAGEAQLAEQRQENMLRNHTSVMSSNTFFLRLSETFSADEQRAIQQPYLPPDAVASKEGLIVLLTQKIDVEREHGRDFFIVRAKHRHPETAILLANRFAEHYIGFLREDSQRHGRSGLTLLEQQAAKLTGEIRKLEDQRREYRQSFGFITVEENQGVIGDRLRRINGALSDIRIQRVSLENQLREAKSASATSRTPFENLTLASFGTNQALREELSRLLSQRAVLATQYGPKHPKMVEVDRMAAAIHRNLEDNFKLALADLQAKVNLAASTEQQLGEGLTTAFNESLALDKLAGRFNTLGEELSAKIKAQSTLLQHIAQTDLALSMPTNAMRVVDAAYLVDKSRRRTLILCAIGVTAALAFVGAPLLLHLLDGKLSASADVEEVLGRDLLGAIPSVRGIPRQRRPHIVRDALDPAMVDRFLGIADRIELSEPSTASKVILVTSTLPDEGKSMIASNLTAALTRIGRRTILVDCDFRRPTQQTIHDVPNDAGLLVWAEKGFPSDDLLAVDGAVGLKRLADGSFLIPAGGIEHHPSRFLAAPSFHGLIQQLRLEFSVVIIDTPPMGIFPDALILARLSTASIVVGRDGVAAVQQIQRVFTELDGTEAPPLGLILNAFSRHATHPSLAYRHRGVGYGYGDSGSKIRRAEKAIPATKQN